MSNVSRPERRVGSRARSHGRAWADPGGFAVPIDCKVQDRSALGAKIIPLGSRELPDSFVLRLPEGGPLMEATVVWRENGAVGVRWVQNQNKISAG